MSVTTIEILSHADYSGRIRRQRDASGLQYFKKAVDRIRNNDPDHTLLLDAGDNSKHLLWDDFVQEEVKWLKTDVFELGNHEFDKGAEELEKRIARLQGHTEVLCSNIVYRSDGSFIRGVKPYVVLEKGNVRYGILGLCTEYTPYMVTGPMIEPFKVLDSVQLARRYIPQMRREGAEIIILLTHFPFYEDHTGEMFSVFEQIKDLKPDVMIGGHIPGDFAEVVDGCCITKAGFGGKSLGRATLLFDEESRKVINRKAEVIDVWNGEKEEDAETLSLISEVMAPYEYYFSEPLCEIERDLPMRLDFESPMGDLIADGVREMTGKDFVYFNCTSCGRKMEKGPLTRFGISEAMGFNDELYESVYTGKDIRDLFEHVHVPERFGNNGNIIFSGLMVKMDHTRPAGQKVVFIRDMQGNDIEDEREFTVMTSQYMSTGGNDTRAIAGRKKWNNTHLRVHDVLADYFRKVGKVDEVKLGRYEFIGKPENDNSPW
ncbi:MAG: 5'-nucleotidase C-terminal domain-containing protein [Erysipelotrichaceae bacterium]|nr:5'-nucleotidase C-terminal domain-containing protein [Erysipelotrichaceae bacterium]